jgi:SAM-dependent methyltransferase
MPRSEPTRPEESTHPTIFNAEYYSSNGQIGDRPALGWYQRLVRRYVGSGPYLDFGCGTGHLVRRLAAVAPTAGFEVSEFSAEAARTTALDAPVYTRLEDIPNAAFAGLTAIHVLEHLTDHQVAAALETWRRALRPGGRALVVVPDPAGRAHALTGLAWAGFSDPTHINLKPHAEWHRVFTAAGWSVAREGSDGLWDVPYGRLPKVLDAVVHSGPALAQFLAGRLFLRPGSGESGVFVVERPG